MKNIDVRAGWMANQAFEGRVVGKVGRKVIELR